MRTAFTFTLLSICGLAACCFSDNARQTALLPAMQQAWPGVREDVQAGVFFQAEAQADATELAVQMMDEALASGQRNLVAAAPWPTLREAAELGIDGRLQSGSLFQPMAVSLRERLSNFEEAWSKIQ